MSFDIKEWRQFLAGQMALAGGMADFDKISVPRPKPGDVLIAACDADGAWAWMFCPKADLAELGPMLLPILEDGQQRVHEQRQATTVITDSDHGQADHPPGHQ
jgi:hypothetical protein